MRMGGRVTAQGQFTRSSEGSGRTQAVLPHSLIVSTLHNTELPLTASTFYGCTHYEISAVWQSQHEPESTGTAYFMDDSSHNLYV